jgi:hypothetical protein
VAGCLKNTFAVMGCLIALMILVVLGWVFQAPIRDGIYRVVGGGELVEIAGAGHPSPEWAASAREKQDAMARFMGPVTVTLNSAEIASLVLDGLDPRARPALDSISVILTPDRVAFEAQLMTDIWGRDVLGPFGGLLRPRETLRVAGPAMMDRPGVLAWIPDELSIRSIPIPPFFIATVVNSVTGGDDGRVLLATPATIRAMTIQTDRVTFSRREMN